VHVSLSARTKWVAVGLPLLLRLLLAPTPAAGLEERTIPFGGFGDVTVYRPSQTPAHVVLFASGDGGWNLGVIDMARALAGLDALVIGFDVRRLLAGLDAGGGCAYPAADLERLSQYVQKKLGLPTYTRPVLVGYSSGATLVYAALAQSPPTTFRGAISLGFCPDLPVKKPFCRGQGLAREEQADDKAQIFLPGPLPAPWVAMQGEIDEVCAPTVTSDFVAKVPQGSVVMLPKVGHGFSVQKNWMPQFKEAFAGVVGRPAAAEASAQSRAQALADLPLVEKRAAGPSKALAVFYSGDGGWASIDRQIAEVLAADGVDVVGVDSLSYFWTARTPEGAARDLARILEHYTTAWGHDRAELIGYSLGADVLPFLVTRLDPGARARVAGMTVLGTGRWATFEFHLSDWLSSTPASRQYPVADEIGRIADLPILCVYGSDEPDSACSLAKGANVTKVATPGGHHFAGEYELLAQRILRHITSR
jgi:type IV secretory pathway VirJ component